MTQTMVATWKTVKHLCTELVVVGCMVYHLTQLQGGNKVVDGHHLPCALTCVNGYVLMCFCLPVLSGAVPYTLLLQVWLHDGVLAVIKYEHTYVHIY